MKKLLIVICTKAKTEEEFEKRPIFDSLKKQCELNSAVEFFIFKDNKQGLSHCYNNVLKNEREKTVLFVHDDVVLEDVFLYEKLTESPYTITGLAGAKSFNKSSEQLAWHLCAPKSDFVGEVAHKSPDGAIWTTVFGPTESRALVLDGLFLSVKTSDLKEKDLEFDERYSFHFYDIAFCLRAYEKRITCGVRPIRAIHYGLGDSMLTEQWKTLNTQFKTDYCS